MKTTITKSILMALALIAIAPSANAQIASKEYVDDALSGKMNTMTVDDTPTTNSTNLVSSGGVAAAIASAVSNVDLSGKQDVLGGGNDAGKVVVAGSTAGTVSYTGIDSQLTVDSDNLITSGAVMDALRYQGLTHIDPETGDSVLVEDWGEYALARVGQRANGVFVSDSDGVVNVASGLTNSQISSNANVDLAKLHFPTPPAACQQTGGSCSLLYVGGTGYVWEVISRDTGESAPTAGAVSAQSSGNSYTTMQSVSVPTASETSSWITSQQEI